MKFYQLDLLIQMRSISQEYTFKELSKQRALRRELNIELLWFQVRNLIFLLREILNKRGKEL
jgi:hypothetical protein